jgi:arylsulfatase A-like enzyme
MRKRSTFTWVHYYEPHTTPITRSGDTEALARQSYAQLVREVDKQIGRLWSELERLDYLKDSLIIIFSDHGEALGEFGYFGHHVYLNQFATDVPLIVHAPDVAPGNVNQLALLSDIAPTVLNWVGLPSSAYDARDLLSLRDDHSERFGVSEAFPVRGRALYEVARSPIHTPAELNKRIEQLRTAAIDYQPKVSLVSDRYRLIVNRVTGNEEFYDRVKDPTEKDDLAPQKLKIHKRMRRALKTTMEQRSERIYCRVQNASLAPAQPDPQQPEKAPEGRPAGL